MKNQYPAGTLSLEAAQDTIYDWITTITRGVLDSEVQVIWRNQSEPLPARPCVTLKFTNVPALTDRDASRFYNPTTGLWNMGMQMEAAVSIQVFGNTKVNRPMAMQLAIDLHSSLMRQTIKDALNQGGVSIQGVGKPTNMTAIEESQFEERAGFEIEIGLVQNIADDIGTIETVNVQGTVGENTLPVQQIILP